jgi:hypothetical protein
VFNSIDIRHISERLGYIEINERHWHGGRFVDITGKQLEIIRLFESVDTVLCELAHLYPVRRVDVFVDVTGRQLDAIKLQGTTISNNGRIETIYSHHLKIRGDCGAFGRAYDAKAAQHYAVEMTRFEIEYKREHASALLGTEGWSTCPIGVTLRNIKAMFNVDIKIDGIKSVDLHAPQRRLAHSREKFYARYGRNILIDLEEMGIETLYSFIMNALTEKDIKDNENH